MALLESTARGTRQFIPGLSTETEEAYSLPPLTLALVVFKQSSRIVNSIGFSGIK
ncbi:hypothetical protein GA0070624_5188 [Micromonospora rhizosphaerae]|uniref:Uncharacterized protein n=1 Tax=Micromonospora rhizosphaerae TaxID=568872 RepID=A0A1C6T086_9ACTN|nr:hypothetical protein GA0070624_5188 [Micromonospora rhizosphaerae]